jgi:twitching motility protein PilT
MDIATLTQILEIAFEKKVSDIHFEVDSPPIFRARGHLIYSKLSKLTPKDTEFIAASVMGSAGSCRNITEFDFSNVGRFVSASSARGNIGLVMRVIPHYIGTFDELNLSPVLGNTVRPRTVLSRCGPTGNGIPTLLR